MVKFTFNLDGVVYQDGVSNILVSFNAAHDALDQQYKKAEAEAADYERSIDDGAEPIEERDEDGHLIYTHSDLLEMHIRDANDAARVLRKAFAITIYHYWERNALRWIGKDKLEHSKLVKRVQAIGYPIAPRLEELHLLVNLLKHNNPVWGQRLYAVRPDLFWVLLKPDNPKPNWEARVVLSREHIEQFVDTIAFSGPTTETLRTDQTD
ncbi:hypothetical protein DM806_20255 [Sphingobium lactosutens]|nr:hypothetical protein [Sphingobium lactosutens]